MENKEILLYKLKPLKGSRIPSDFIVTFFDGTGIDWVHLNYRDGEWTDSGEKHGVDQSITKMVPSRRVKSAIWMVGWKMYQMLCWQKLYKQLENVDVLLKKFKPKGKAEKETFMLLGDHPTIVDLVIAKQNIHCIDLENFGIEIGHDLSDACSALKLWIKTVVTNHMGSLSSTAAGQGKNRFRSQDLPKHSVFAHQVPEVRKLERDANYAGRCEAWQIGRITEMVYHLDVKSMYSYIGSKECFPVKLIEFGKELDLHRASCWVHEGYHVIARVEIYTDSPAYPVRHQKITLYPTGSFLTTLCNPELKYALSKGHVVRILNYAVYKTAPIFKENSQWYFNARKSLREQGLEMMAGPFKLAQNSMYQSIGMRGRNWVEQDPVIDKKWGERWGRHPVTDEPCIIRAVYGVEQYQDLRGEPDQSVPAVSSTMCSYGRMHDWHLICQAEIKNCFYTDTDGIMVNKTGAFNLYHKDDNPPPLPGELDCREFSPDPNQTNKDIDIRGLKHYRFGDRWCQAGIPSSAQRNEDGSVVFSSYESFDRSLWHMNPLIYKVEEHKRRTRSNYRHGIVDKNGRVTPFTMRIVKDEDTGEERNELL